MDVAKACIHSIVGFLILGGMHLIFSQVTFFMLRFLFSPSLLCLFIIKVCWILTNPFSASIKTIVLTPDWKFVTWRFVCRGLIVTCICHYVIIQDSFTALKVLCVLPIHAFLPHPLATVDLFTVYIVLSFPDCHTVGIIQYVPFSDYLLPLSNIHWSFLHVFPWLNSHFLLVLKNIPSTEYIIVYLSIHQLKYMLVASRI